MAQTSTARWAGRPVAAGTLVVAVLLASLLGAPVSTPAAQPQADPAAAGFHQVDATPSAATSLTALVWLLGTASKVLPLAVPAAMAAGPELVRLAAAGPGVWPSAQAAPSSTVRGRAPPSGQTTR